MGSVTEFKRQFLPNNVLYEARRKLRDLKQTGSIRDYVKEITTLMLQIPNLTSDDLLFHFMDGWQNWAKQELQRRRVIDVDQAIVEAESTGCQGYVEKKIQAEKKGCYICGGPHGFQSCPDLKES